MVNRTTFETINIDDFNHDPINQAKVQSYPPELVGRFNSFIVTAFDDSMTVEMQIRTLIKWIKENIDVTTNALDNMEAFKQDSMAFQNHVKNTLVNLINQFTDKFDDNLKAETLEILNQWFEDGVLSDLVRNAINEEVIGARGGKDNLGQRLDETDQRLDEIDTHLAQTAKKGYFLKLEENIELYFKERTSSGYHAMYDSLLSDTRMKKRYLGYDQSGQYEINLYIYQPANFKRTIFVTCAIHGWEHYGTLVMYEVLKRILDENISPQYAELRNTRILVIPVANPWGMNQTSAQEIRRGNSRGVDLNRNFDYRWSENVGSFGLTKGEEPFSEVETKIIKQVLEEYIIDSYIDLHNFVNLETETRDYLFYGNEKIKANTNQLVQWLKSQYDGVNISHIVAANDSSANNYAIEVLNIPAINIELIRNRHGSDDDRRWVEVMLNYLKLQSDTYNMVSNIKYGIKSNVRLQNKIANRPIPTEITNIHELNLTYNIDTDGIFTVNGFVTFEVTSNEMAIVTIIPTIEQDRELKTLDINSPFISKPYMKVGKGTYTLPINTMVHVRRVNGDAHFSCGIILEGTGTAVIKIVQANYVFLPGTLTYAHSDQHVPYKYS